jgi:RimJ/RimL family protein N-acetyltransferase
VLSRVEDGVFGRGDADVVVDPTLGAERESRLADGASLLLRGSRYAPLRHRVTDLRGSWRWHERVRRVLVVMGGADPLQLAPATVDLLGRTGVPLKVAAIVGAERNAAEQAAVAYPALSLTTHASVDDLPELMVQCDAVVSAAGTSVWELCCLGPPMALVCAVHNQRSGYERVIAAGAAIGLGDGEALRSEAAAAQLRDMLTNGELRRQLSARARTVVDGLGAWRVVATWERLVEQRPAGVTAGQRSEVGDASLSIRRAGMDDARRLLDWRNDRRTREVSRESGEVSWEEHVAWLESSLPRPDRLLLVAVDGNGPVGTVRWDQAEEAEWEVSITVAPQRRGQGLAKALLAAGERVLTKAAGGVWCLATVHTGNVASRRLFLAAGYVPDAPANADGFERYAAFRSGPS